MRNIIDVPDVAMREPYQGDQVGGRHVVAMLALESGVAVAPNIFENQAHSPFA